MVVDLQLADDRRVAMREAEVAEHVAEARRVHFLGRAFVLGAQQLKLGLEQTGI